MNISQYEHYDAVSQGIIVWCSRLLHKNVHAIESIERELKKRQLIKLNDDHDTVLLIADERFPQTRDFRKLCYKAYQALPSERLARFAQEKFEQRIYAGLQTLAA